MQGDAIVALIALICLACLFYGPWQEACTDVTRQYIFERRDRLFDLAYAGLIDFNSREYILARCLMESMIRYAHELTWPYLVFYALFSKRVPEEPSLDDELAHIADARTRRFVMKLLLQSTFAMVAMMATKSIILWPVGVLLCVLMRYTNISERLDSENKVTKAIHTGAQYAEAT